MLEEKVLEEETREIPIGSHLTDYAQNKCKKKKFNKEYYKCKEREKGYKCLHAVKANNVFYCPR